MRGALRSSQTYRFVVGAVALALLSACQDTPSTSPADPGPQLDISEARTDGGNPDFFFAAPLATTPQAGDANFDEGAANEALVPYFRVCETDEAPSPAGCTLDVTGAVTGSATGLAMTYDPDTELYQLNWKTDQLVEGTTYRIEIWGLALASEAEKAQIDGRWLFGWRDIAHAPSTANCSTDTEVCLINFGQTIPVKVRVEDFVFCPVDRNCAVQFIAAGTDANLEATLGDPVASSAQLFIPGQSGTDFALAFEPCDAADEARVDAAIDLPTFGPCLRTVTPPTEVTLTDPAVISLCTIDEAGKDAIRDQLADPGSLHELKLHHFSTGGVPDGPVTSVEAWPEVAAACGEPTSGGLAMAEPEGLLGHALALADRALSLRLFRPQRLVALDQGGGGEGFGVFSLYKLALPAKFEYENAGDEFQTALAGSDVPLRARVTDLAGRPVMNARVTWDAVSTLGGESVGPSPVLSSGDGIAATTATLSPSEGDNVFHASGKGIADDRELGCTLPGGAAGTAACNGPRSSFDPFQPNTFALNGGVETIPDGTRLPFTVFGCLPGRGTPVAIDGVLSAGEWQCANSTTFPANLSGGSTVDATLYWMNDDTDLHFAVSVPGSDRTNALRLDFDNDGDGVEGGSNEGVREIGDDVWEFEPDIGPADKFIDEGCSDSSQSGCGSSDADFGGGLQTVAAFDNTQGGVTVYEMSHSLATGDLCTVDGKKGCGAALGESIDLDVAAGRTVGVFLTLRVGSGAQGNTQWPGFLDYFPVEIR